MEDDAHEKAEFPRERDNIPSSTSRQSPQTTFPHRPFPSLDNDQMTKRQDTGKSKGDKR